ncbi:MAG: hypothetical protein DMG39_05825 [Acidobacteria bacterium]|nr:MAG: hypothetical protein DMG39_05825 [Acidobacteriota bacterium]
MNLSPFQNFIWIAGTVLKLLLCVLVFARGLHRRLPLFSLYIALLLPEAVGVHWVYRHWGYTSQAAKYFYWMSLGIVLCARALAVAELCWRSLRDSPAVWGTVRKPLVLLASALLVYAAVSAASNRSPMIAFTLAVERSLDFGIVVILAALAGLGVRYKVWLGQTEKKVVLGFAVYSAFQVVNDALMEKWMMQYFRWWVSASVISFDAALLIWIVPLLRPLPPLTPPPTLFSQEESTAILAQILEQLRRIVQETKRVLRSRWK